ncbi:MAG: alpha/beta fold hydrolase [Cyclobacteriaceae bacterium]
MKTRRWIKISFPFLLIFGLYFLGPKPDHPELNDTLALVTETPEELECYIKNNELRYNVKPDNEARVIWHDSTRRKTEYAVIYLHGFSASQKEGDPVHRRFAKNFGCNLFLPRLSDHGIDTTETLLLFTADRFWNSAKEALAIGQKLGEKVILISTSSGSTLALMLAAKFPDQVHALINLSPNIALKDPAAFILNDPWGLHIARAVMGGKNREPGFTEEEAKFWNKKYRLESLVQLQELLESSMKAETFRRITQPSLTLYYFKNEQEQDPQVKVSAMLEMHQQLSTPDSLKIARSMPDAGAHVLGSSMTSNDVEGVYSEIEKFALTKLHMTTINSLADNK